MGKTCRVWDYQGEPVPAETSTHSHLSWSSTIPYQLPAHTTIHSILSVQFTCKRNFLYNLSTGPHWSCSWTGTIQFILHTYPDPVIIFFSQHMPILSQPFGCST